MNESQNGEAQSVEIEEQPNNLDTSTAASTDEPAMEKIDEVSEAVQTGESLPENCDHLDEHPVFEIHPGDDLLSSVGMNAMNDQTDELVEEEATYSQEAEEGKEEGEGDEGEGEGEREQEEEEEDREGDSGGNGDGAGYREGEQEGAGEEEEEEEEVKSSDEENEYNSQDSGAKEELHSVNGDVVDLADSMENLEAQESILRTDSTCTEGEKSLKDEPLEDDLPLVENELGDFDTPEDDRIGHLRFSELNDDPSKAMRLAAEVASSLLPPTEPSGPSQSTISQSGIQQKRVKKRIDVLSLPVVDNPLQKEGRHTVIRGRLPDNHPFLIAAQNLGFKLVSKKLNGFGDEKDEDSRRDLFHKDLREFLKEIHSKNTKLPIIGGGNLDLYGLMKEVLLLGGVENVVKKRAFRIVAQQLELPKSCTSAAYVLKGAYEKFLYFYETRLVYGTWPDNAGRRVDMKSRVIEQKQREKLASQANQANGAKKRRRSDPNDLGKSSLRKRALEMDPRILQMLSTISNDAEATHKYLRTLASESGDQFDLPDWAVQVPDDESYLGVIERTQKMDDSDEIRTCGEVILLAMAECFLLLSSTGSPIEPARTRDLGLAKAICLLPISASVTRKAQACLFSLIIHATKIPSAAVLASNQSGNGLIDGIFSLVQVFYTRNVDKPTGDTIPFIDSQNHVINRDAAAAYCGLRILRNLSKEPRNRPPIARHAGIGKVLLPVFQMIGLYRDFAVTVLDIFQEISTDISKAHIDGILEGLLPLLESSCAEESPDFDVSTRALTVLSWATEELDEGSLHIASVITMVSSLLHCQISIVNTPALAMIVNSLVEKFGDAVSGDERFIEGMFILLKDTRCTGVVAQSLVMLHRFIPLNDFAIRAGLEYDNVGANREDGELLEASEGLEELSEEFQV